MTRQQLLAYAIHIWMPAMSLNESDNTVVTFKSEFASIQLSVGDYRRIAKEGKAA